MDLCKCWLEFADSCNVAVVHETVSCDEVRGKLGRGRDGPYVSWIIGV